jgi:hypothetical protein
MDQETARQILSICYESLEEPQRVPTVPRTKLFYQLLISCKSILRIEQINESFFMNFQTLCGQNDFLGLLKLILPMVQLVNEQISQLITSIYGTLMSNQESILADNKQLIQSMHELLNCIMVATSTTSSTSSETPSNPSSTEEVPQPMNTNSSQDEELAKVMQIISQYCPPSAPGITPMQRLVQHLEQMAVVSRKYNEMFRIMSS